MASIQNLASGVLVSDISGTATSLSVNCGEGSSSTLTAVWPSVPFYITVMPAYPTVGVANSLDSEIMLVSALSASDNVITMTVSRGQRGTTAKAFSEGAIITNGIYTADMDYAQAVGKSFFSATLTNSSTGSYTVSDSMLPNTPEDGMSIRVVFGTSWTNTSVTPKLRLNSGSYSSIYAGNNLRSDAGTANTKAMVKSGVIYELTYYNGAWYVLNLIANSGIVSDNIDFTTFPCTFGNGLVSSPNGTRSYIQIGSLLIQYGTRRGGSFQDYQSCTFLVPFASDNYSLNITNQFPENGGSIWYAFVRSKTTTGFQYGIGLDGGGYFGGNADNIANWIAIGIAGD